MSINIKEIKEFWEARAKAHEDNPGLTNLEENPTLRKLKIKLENKKVNEYLNLKNSNATLLDLGGGYGEWAFNFANRIKKIYVVDYCENLIQRGIKKAKQKKINNIEFIHSAVQNFNIKIKFDIIFISGLLVHLNDNDIDKLIRNIKDYSKKGTSIILRDGTGIKDRFEIKNRFSEALKTNYSAIYRTREEYIKLFEDAGFQLLKDENLFPEGCPLNKFPETRLRIYKFRKIK